MRIQRVVMYAREYLRRANPETGVGEIVETDSRMEHIARILFLISVFLLPFFIIPSVSFPFQFTKFVIVFIPLVIAILLFAIARFREGVVVFPKHSALLAVFLLPSAYILSGLFSNNFGVSFFGQGFGVDTVSFIIVGALLTYSIAVLFRHTKDVAYLILSLLGGGLVLGLVQFIRLLGGGDVLSFSVLLSSTANLLGKWNDLALFFAVIAVVALSALAIFPRRTIKRSVLIYGTLIVSTFYLTVVNFFLAWAVLSLFAFAYFVFGLFSLQFMRTGGMFRQELTTVSLIIIILAASFMLFDGLGNSISSSFNVSQIEARPSWQTTLEITGQSYKESFFFGSGPNTFIEEWSQFRPRGVNESIFWNTDFSAGIGYIPTSFVTTGVLGAIAWIFFLGLFGRFALRSMSVLWESSNRMKHFLHLASTSSAVMLWIFSIFYLPSTSLILLTFILTGLSFATARGIHPFPFSQIIFSRNPRLGFLTSFALSAMILISVGGLYIVAERYISTVSFLGARVAFANNDIEKGDRLLTRALRIEPNDAHYRLLAESSITRLSRIVNENQNPDQAVQQEFQTVLTRGIQAGIAARNFNPEYYANWLTLSRVYRSVVPLNLEGAYESARETLREAITRAPLHPLLSLERARLEIAEGDLAEARVAIREALQKKNNYTEAVFLLSQIEAQEGNLPEAIRTAEAATIIAPTDPIVYFQLGILTYANNSFSDAQRAFERAVSLNRDYANALYFLGLSHFQLGNQDEAIDVFARVATLNPDNNEVQIILQNIRAGKAPFEDSSARSPEERARPPITE